MTLNVSKNAISARSCLFNVARFQRKTQTFRRGVRLVNSHMAPPNTSVVPQMVVRVVIVNTKRDFCLRSHFFKSLLVNTGSLRSSQPSAFAFGEAGALCRYCCDATEPPPVQKKSILQQTCRFKRVVCAVLRDRAQSFAGKFDANVLVQLGHPNAFFLKVGIYRAVHGFRNVTTDTALFLGKTGAMNAATLVRNGTANETNSGHKIFAFTVKRSGILHCFPFRSSKTALLS